MPPAHAHVARHTDASMGAVSTKASRIFCGGNPIPIARLMPCLASCVRVRPLLCRSYKTRADALRLFLEDGAPLVGENKGGGALAWHSIRVWRPTAA